MQLELAAKAFLVCDRHCPLVNLAEERLFITTGEILMTELDWPHQAVMKNIFLWVTNFSAYSL